MGANNAHVHCPVRPVTATMAQKDAVCSALMDTLRLMAVNSVCAHRQRTLRTVHRLGLCVQCSVSMVSKRMITDVMFVAAGLVQFMQQLALCTALMVC